MSKFTQQQNSVTGTLRKIFSLKFFVMGVVLVVLGTYLWQVNNLANTSYKIKNLEKQVATLKISGKELENKATRLRSLTEIQNKISLLALQSAAKVEYVNPIANVIAQK